MASEVFFTTNANEFERLEGLYISERNPPGFIRGIDLSKVGMAGRCVRGPGTVQDILSSARFVEVYGERDFGSGGALIGEIWKGLLNKRFGSLKIRRVIGAGSVVSSFDAEDGTDGTGAAILTIAGSSAGLWGQDVKWRVVDASDGDALKFNLVIRYLGEEITYENLNTQANEDNLAEVVGDDIARFITLTKVADGRPGNTDLFTGDFATALDSDKFMNLGETVTGYTSVAGTEGTVVATDYTTGITELANTAGLGVVLVPESLEDAVAPAAQGTLNTTIVSLAALANDRVFLTWSGKNNQSPTQDIASEAADITTRSDRIIWCYNPGKTLDPETGLKIDQSSHMIMASIFTQNDVDIHPGSRQAAKAGAAFSELQNETLSREELIALKEAGISALEKLKSGFQFRSGVTTSLVTGKTEITRRRSADFLQISSSDRLADFVKGKNTTEKRALMGGELVAFTQGLKDKERIVENFVVDQVSVNTKKQREKGLEKILWRVRLIGHILALVLETDIGTGVTIEA
jgi:hypothetical protein